MAGRHPLPTQLKKLRGNPGGRPLNENEPQPALCLPEPPEWLDDLAKEIFQLKADELYHVGLLTVLDIDVLATYCDMLSQYHRLRKQIENEGFVYYGGTIIGAGHSNECILLPIIDEIKYTG